MWLIYLWIDRAHSFSFFTSKINTSVSLTSISSNGILSSNNAPLIYLPDIRVSLPRMDSMKSVYISRFWNFQNRLKGNLFSARDNFLPKILDNFLVTHSIFSFEPTLIEYTFNNSNYFYLISFTESHNRNDNKITLLSL